MIIPVHRGLDYARPRLETEADRMQRLADDLRRIADGAIPTIPLLEEAPVADRWSFAMWPVPVIVGLTVGHPRLPVGPVRTTEIVACDLVGGWARTLSRFYVLGRHLSEGDAHV